jgi:hypothetical protein
MKHATCLLAGILSLGILTVSSPALAVKQSNLDKCIKRLVTEGGERLESVKIKGHDFHCYPAKISEANGVKTLVGRLHHDIWNLPGDMREDDQVTFKISVKNGEVLMDQPSFKLGGIIGALSRAADAAGVISWLPKKQAEDILRVTAGTVTGKGWKGVANHIIANAALKFAKLK